MNKDFNDFVNSSEVNVPLSLSNKVFTMIKNDLNPSHKVIFSKIIVIQGLVGFLTLLFCPQFKFSLTNRHELFHYFHYNYGEFICMAICGSIFLGTGAFFASYILKQSEMNKVKKSKFLYYLSISAIALSTFLLIGAQVYITLATVWLCGAILGGMFIFEVNTIIRIKILKY